jgi:transcriptional regulator with XRE-family HTH domain
MKAEWFAGRLRELRTARGWTQQQLADAAGVTASTVRSIEQGWNKPAWDTVLALCRALVVRPDAFTHAPAERALPRRGRPRKVPAAAPASAQQVTRGKAPRGRKSKRRR